MENLLGCPESNASSSAVDFGFYGNQRTCHVDPARVRPAAEFGLAGNHFGVILEPEAFDALEGRLRAAGKAFLKAPETQHAGTSRERRKMIFTDPSGNAIEVKSYLHHTDPFG